VHIFPYSSTRVREAVWSVPCGLGMGCGVALWVPEPTAETGHLLRSQGHPARLRPARLRGRNAEGARTVAGEAAINRQPASRQHGAATSGDVK
jgi:hypothetical protein